MTSPLKFNVAELLRSQGAEAMPTRRTQRGPAPERIGVEMIGIEKDSDIVVEAVLTPLGGGMLVDADISGELHGECARCLRELKRPVRLHVSQVFSADESFITGGDAEDEEGTGDEVPQVIDEEIDLLQTVINEAGLTLPFAPTCEEGCDIELPEGVSTGVSGEEPEAVDPRWAGLEKFL